MADTKDFAKFASKDLIITKKINNVIYELMVKTKANMVYTDDDTTLSETLDKIFDLLTNQSESYDDLKKAYDAIVKDADENFNSFKEIYDYININGKPESELIQLINSKQKAEDGKGLSTHDFTDLLYKKVTNMYSKEDLDLVLKELSEKVSKNAVDIADIDSRLQKVETKMSEEGPNIVVTEDSTGERVPDGDVWYNIVK